MEYVGKKSKFDSYQRGVLTVWCGTYIHAACQNKITVRYFTARKQTQVSEEKLETKQKAKQDLSL